MAKSTSVSLGEHFEKFIARTVKSGRYGNASDVMRAGLRLLEEQERREQTLEMVKNSIEEIQNGRTRPAKDALQDIAKALKLDLED